MAGFGALRPRPTRGAAVASCPNTDFVGTRTGRSARPTGGSSHPIDAMGQRQDLGRDARGKPAARTARAVSEVPWIVDQAVEDVFRAVNDAIRSQHVVMNRVHLCS